MLNGKVNDMATAKKSGKMAVTKATTKTAAKKTAAKKSAKKSAVMKKGSKYACGVCGLSVIVDTACGCAETACLICCEKPMKMKK